MWYFQKGQLHEWQTPVQEFKEVKVLWDEGPCLRLVSSFSFNGFDGHYAVSFLRCE